MIDEISEFFYSFKNKIIETTQIITEHSQQIDEFAKQIKNENLKKDYEENFLTILGYTYRLDDSIQRVYFTFQEAIYAIDLDKLMRNENSLKLNSIVYILVLDFLIKEHTQGFCDEQIKLDAIETYKKIEERKSTENKKYHIYQN